MKKNMGKTDQMIRVVLGVLFLILAYTSNIWWGLLAVIMLGTAAMGTCPIYSIFGWSTKK